MGILTKEEHLETRHAKAWRSTNQSIPNITNTQISFDNEVYDTDNIINLATQPTRLTCVTVGYYLIMAQAVFTNADVGYRLLSILLNGATALLTVELTADATYWKRLSGATIRPLVAGDYIELRVYQNSGGALNILTGATSPFLMMSRFP